MISFERIELRYVLKLIIFVQARNRKNHRHQARLKNQFTEKFTVTRVMLRVNQKNLLKRRPQKPLSLRRRGQPAERLKPSKKMPKKKSAQLILRRVILILLIPKLVNNIL